MVSKALWMLLWGDLLVQNTFNIPIYCKKGRTMKTLIYIGIHISTCTYMCFNFQKKQCKDKARINIKSYLGERKQGGGDRDG